MAVFKGLIGAIYTLVLLGIFVIIYFMVLFGGVAVISTIIPWGTSTGEIIISIIGILSVILSIGTTYTIISNNK